MDDGIDCQAVIAKLKFSFLQFLMHLDIHICGSCFDIVKVANNKPTFYGHTDKCIILVKYVSVKGR